MTWVVGGKHLFCARCVSDIQVTLDYKNGQKCYFDAVRKIHTLAPNIAIAFAGSIKLAFSIIEELKKETCKNLRNELFKTPEVILKKIQKAIKYFYKKHKTLLDNSVQFMVFVAPTGIYTEFGVWKLASPNFDSISPQKPFELMQIGSGSKINDYKALIKKHERGHYTIPQGDGELSILVIPTGRSGLQYLFADAVEYQNAGISSSMHICRVSHAEINILELPGTLSVDFPEVATTWKELTRILGKKGIETAGCCAIA